MMSHDDLKPIAQNLRPPGHIFCLKLGPGINISESRWPAKQSHFELWFPCGVNDELRNLRWLVLRASRS